MKTSRWLGLFCCTLLAALTLRAGAAEWNLVRFESREYVTLDNIAEFYGFPKPPPVDLTGHFAVPPVGAPAVAPAPVTPVVITPPSGLVTTVEKITDEPSPISSQEPPPAVALSKTIVLDSGKMQIEVTVGLREAQINGVKHWLAFPVALHDGQVLVSRLDLSRIIEPNLRPELIEGMTPVTTVVLDPGHGGHDRGAMSKFGFEKDFALDVALRARKLLESEGYKVVMTRATDVFIPLDQRPAVANTIPNSIFVSIHFNSSSTNADARGFEIFSIAPRGAPSTNDSGPRERDLREEPGNAVDMPSGALAGSVFHALLGHVPMVDRGVKHARFAVLRLCTQPAVLIECGFVSNNAESTLISSSAWRAHVAEAIVDGVANYRVLAERKTRPKVIADYRRAAVTGVNLRDTATP
ncbi:MAG: N-acetylmuramoyl-L-alanine amidase [Chthoniobacter sp.]|uniref:N-acetylmuramoyl-L-alanine amidase family protein n=1 Tax=Chthoniobacter sp. TaxID=2510640 RepID=UPI0032A54546